MEDCSHLDKELGELHRQKETILSQEKVDEDEVVAIDSRIAESLSAKQRDAFQNEIGDMLSVAKGRGKFAGIFDLKERLFVNKECLKMTKNVR